MGRVCAGFGEARGGWRRHTVSGRAVDGPRVGNADGNVVGSSVGTAVGAADGRKLG